MPRLSVFKTDRVPPLATFRMREEGVEPSRSFHPTGVSGPPVYRFQHSRVVRPAGLEPANCTF